MQSNSICFFDPSKITPPPWETKPKPMPNTPKTNTFAGQLTAIAEQMAALGAAALAAAAAMKTQLENVDKICREAFRRSRKTPPPPPGPTNAEIEAQLEAIAEQFAFVARIAADRGIYVSMHGWTNTPFAGRVPTVFVQRKNDD